MLLAMIEILYCEAILSIMIINRFKNKYNNISINVKKIVYFRNWIYS